MLDEQTMQITDFLLPWIGILISLIVAIWVKDMATGMAKGLKFKMNKAFNAGDHVILDGADAIIVSIGMSETVFGIYSDKGYLWRYVPNERIPYLKLEKVINKELHLDTEEERALKIKSTIDTIQDAQIDRNKEAIDKLKG